MRKPVRIILLGEAKNEFEKLNSIIGEQLARGRASSDEMSLLNSIKNKIELIKKNPFYGDNIPKELIPKQYKVPNLWRIELSQFWRMLYTIRGDEIEVICFVLEIVDHKNYNKMFGYK
jgi:Txe/YoeB family toxin of Txe-Axe toxin-antitoxin module